MAEFGNHSTSWDGIINRVAGVLYRPSIPYSPTSDGVLDSISVYSRAASGTINIRMALYDASDGTFVGATVEINIDNVDGWNTANADGTINVYAAKSYYICIEQSANHYISYNTHANHDAYKYKTYGGTWPSPVTWTNGSTYANTAVYATYTPSGGTELLAGTSSSVVTTTGVVKRDRKITGTSSSVATVIGNNQRIVGLRGTTTATATVTGNMISVTPLAGTAASIATVSGNLVVQKLLSGIIYSTITITGFLIKTSKLTGVSSSNASPTGSLKISKKLEGHCQSSSVVNGDVDRLRKFVGYSSPSSSLTGILFRSRKLFGISASSTSLVGTLVIARKLVGIISASSTTTGALPISGETTLSGESSSVVTTFGYLRKIRKLFGTVQASSITYGSLSRIRKLYNTVEVSSTVSGSLKVSGTKLLQGTIQATSTVTGGFVGPVSLNGTVQAVSIVVGSLKYKWFGRIYGTSTVTGSVKRSISLKGVSSSNATVMGNIIGAHVNLRGIITGISTTQGMIGAIRGVVVLSWYPLDEMTTSNILDYVFPLESELRKFEAASFAFVGARTPVGPTPFVTARTGFMPDTFRNDFYYRIHIYNKPIDLGAITTDVSVPLIVWNAYPDPKTLSSIIKSGNPLTVVGQTAPFIFPEYGYQEYSILVAGEGSPVFEAEIDFDFGATETLPVEIIGNRVCVLYWRPQNKIIEVLSSLTRILASGNGTEQRIKVRQIPRQGFKLSIKLDSLKQHALFNSFLHRWQKLTWAIPVWTEYANHEGVINSNDTVIILDTTNADFRDSNLAFIWSSNELNKIVSVETKTSSQLNLSSPVGLGFTGKKVIMPVRLAQMLSRTQKKIYETGLVEISANFQVINNIAITGYTPLQTYDNMEVLTKPTFVDPVQGEDSDPDIYISDYETGIVDVFSLSTYNKQTQSHIWYNDSKADCWRFRQFLHGKNGMQTPFLVPTFRRDLILTDSVQSGDTIIYVENRKLTINLGVNALKTYLAFLVGSNIIVRKIINMSEISSTKEAIQLDASVGVNVSVGTDKICFVDKVRFNSDDIELIWPYTGRNECFASLLRVT